MLLLLFLLSVSGCSEECSRQPAEEGMDIIEKIQEEKEIFWGVF